MAQGTVQADTGLYFARQSSGKGVAATVLKGGLALVNFNNDTDIEKVDGEPMLGAGIYMQKGMGVSYVTNQSGNGWVTLDLFPAQIFSAFMTKGTSTGTAAYTHPYTLIDRNVNLPYLSILLVNGESAAGVGILTTLIRDVRLTSFGFTIDGTDAVKWDATWQGLNQGVGTGSETLSFNTAFNIPDANNAATTYTWPSWFPSTYCLQNVNIKWQPAAGVNPPCIGSGQHGDIRIEKAGFVCTFRFQGDSDAATIYKQINYKAATGLSASAAMSAALKEGDFSFSLASQSLIPTTSTPYSLAGTIPLQWTKAKWVNGSPNVLEVEAVSYGSAATLTAVNATAGASMVI
jgi:hypothetical protein